jgi:hypothetical protein
MKTEVSIPSNRNETSKFAPDFAGSPVEDLQTSVTSRRPVQDGGLARGILRPAPGKSCRRPGKSSPVFAPLFLARFLLSV